MKLRLLFRLGLLILFCLVGVESLQAQTTPNTRRDNFSDIRVDELSDSRIRDFMAEIEASGLTLDQIDQVALSRGMRPAEVKKLKERVDRIRKDDARILRQERTALNQRDSLQRAKIDSLPITERVQIESEAERALSVLKTKIFGSEIFKNARVTPEPDFQIAPTENYRVGPGDEITVEIYGFSEASYPRKVTPEGTINVPNAGVVQVAGLSLVEIRRILTNRLGRIYTEIGNGNTFVNVTTGRLRTIRVNVIGEVTKPNLYTLSSLSTVFTALYASGGPTENGSLREIEVIRGNQVVAKLDVYDFLLRGDQKGNINLRDQDVIRIPVYRSRVEFSGEVKRPALFEVLPGESLADLLRFAGGFTERAYSARIKVLQNTNRERRITDVTEQNFTSYQPKTGDVLVAEPILERFENRVQIEGAVFRPGAYELEAGLTLKSLIQKAEGLKEDAFLPRAFITRVKADNTLELVSFNPGRIVAGTDPDIALRREDVVSISSLFDLRDEYVVSIDGEVRIPGEYPFAESMTLEDLIIKAGGLREGASVSRIEIGRRVKNSNNDVLSAQTADVIQIAVSNDLSTQTSKFVLQPFDIVSVRMSEGYEVQRQAEVKGEVAFPGLYSIIRKNERISDLVKRAGGGTAFAYYKGASLRRVNPTNSVVNDRQRSRQLQVERNSLDALRGLRNNRDSLNIVSGQDSIPVNNLVGIDLETIMQRPGTDIDLFLEDGDVITIPKQPQTVKISGNVLLPGTAIYLPGKGFKSYISKSGGFKQRAAKRRSYVRYANGSVKSTTKAFLFFNNYPRITPGAEIIVPVDEAARRISVQEVIGISSGLLSVVLLALTLGNR